MIDIRDDDGGGGGGHRPIKITARYTAEVYIVTSLRWMRGPRVRGCDLKDAETERERISRFNGFRSKSTIGHYTVYALRSKHSSVGI